MKEVWYFDKEAHGHKATVTHEHKDGSVDLFYYPKGVNPRVSMQELQDLKDAEAIFIPEVKKVEQNIAKRQEMIDAMQSNKMTIKELKDKPITTKELFIKLHDEENKIIEHTAILDGLKNHLKAVQAKIKAEEQRIKKVKAVLEKKKIVVKNVLEKDKASIVQYKPNAFTILVDPKTKEVTKIPVPWNVKMNCYKLR